MTNVTKVRDYIKEVEIADIETLKSLFPNISQILNRLVKRGEIIRIKRGYYASVPFNPFKIAKYLSSGYVSFYSALYYYGVVSAVPSTIFIATRRISRERIIFDTEFKEVSIGRRFCGYIENDIRVATRAKAIYDSLRRPDLGGGFSRILAAIEEMHLNEDEWREILNYMRKFDRKSFFQRVGYLFSLLPSTPKWVLKELKSKVSKVKVYLLGRSPGKFVKEWNVIDNVGKEVLLSWMRG